MSFTEFCDNPCSTVRWLNRIFSGICWQGEDGGVCPGEVLDVCSDGNWSIVGVAGPLQDAVINMKAIKNNPKSARTEFMVIDFRIFHQLPLACPDMARWWLYLTWLLSILTQDRLRQHYLTIPDSWISILKRFLPLYLPSFRVFWLQNEEGWCSGIVTDGVFAQRRPCPYVWEVLTSL